MTRVARLLEAATGLFGIAAVTAGVWVRYGTAFGLIAGGALLIVDKFTG